jgi:hypothetical protein
MAHELRRQGVGGGGASQLRSSRCSVLHLASRHHQTGVPTGSSAADGRLHPIGVNAGACQKPRDQRVRVPHLTGSQLVPTPHGCRDGGRQIENALRANDVRRHPDRTRQRVGQIGDGASPPTTDLVSEVPPGRALRHRPAGACDLFRVSKQWGSAVLTAVRAGRARPYTPKLSALFRQFDSATAAGVAPPQRSPVIV